VPVLDGGLSIPVNSHAINKNSQSNKGVEIAFLLTQEMLIFVDLITGVYFLKGVFSIYSYLKAKHKQGTDTKFFLLHAIAFTLFMLVNIIEIIAFNLLLLYEDNTQVNLAYNIIQLLLSLFTFIQQTLICVILWDFGKEEDDEEIEPESTPG